jgi:hypothetical protein
VSDIHPPPPRLPPPAQRNGCLTAIMVVAGLIMLLPGLCAIFFGVASLRGFSMEPLVMQLVVLGLLIGGFGIVLLRLAIKGQGR